MTTKIISNSSNKLVLSVVVLNMLMVLTGLVLSWGNMSLDASFLRELFRATGAVAYSIIAILIFNSHPRHMVGRLFLIIGFFSALGNLQFGLDLVIRLEVVRILNNWIGHIAWVPAFLIPISLVLLYFPDGHLPSKRWTAVSISTILGIVGIAISYALHPWPWEAAGINDPRNPFGIPNSERFFEILWNVSQILLIPGLIGSLLAVIYRFRRSQGVERIQIKWVIYTALIAIPPLLMFYNRYETPYFDLYFISLPTILASAMGIAILRFRLFDIDLIIRRTLQYAVITGLLALIYFGGVVVLQWILRPITGSDNSPMVTVITTLAIAVLFNPLRHRIQEFIDQRFFRQKYDAERTLAGFARTVRDEVDQEKLTLSLLSVVENTMKPELTSLWLVSEDEVRKS